MVMPRVSQHELVGLVNLGPHLSEQAEKELMDAYAQASADGAGTIILNFNHLGT